MWDVDKERKENVLLILESIAVVLLLTYCFYRNWWAILPVSIVGFLFYKEEKRDQLMREKEERRQQFKELLYLTVTGIKAGYSVENAFLNSYEDLKNRYGRDSYICHILLQLQEGLRNHDSATNMWKTIGENSRIVEIRDFAEVFDVAKKYGGNMTKLLENTADVIGKRVEIKKEIYVFLSAKRLELKIMNVMPPAIMLYMEFTSPGYFSKMYDSLNGVMIMTACLCLYVTAYGLGRKIITGMG